MNQDAQRDRLRAGLQGDYNAPMFLTKPARSLVALLTLATVLFCHTATATQAYLASPWSAGAAAGVPPCHGLANDGDFPPGFAPSPCESAQAVGEKFQPVIAAAPLLLAWIAAFEAPAVLCASPAAHGTFGIADASPPLHLLYCRLLN